jgi:ribosomal protein S7
MQKTEEEVMIGFLMRDGSRSRARRVLTEALDQVQAKVRSSNRREILFFAVHNAAPVVATGTQTRASNRVQKGIRAILAAARRDRGRVTTASLAAALLAAYPVESLDPDRPRAASRISVRSLYRA